MSPWRDFSPDLLTSALKCTDGVLGDLARGRFWPPAERAAYDRDFAGLFLDAPDRVFDREGWGA